MKKSTAYKSKLTILALSVLFILTTIIGLSMFAPRAAYADPDYNLRFKQVALGGDFAVAVDYKGGLYGWSLLDTAESDKFGTWNSSTNATTLGAYYPSVPTKIQLDASVESVKMVAATRYNAALITSDGRVYTWGSVQQKNATDSLGGYSSFYLMHLRGNNVDSSAVPLYVPGEIEKSFYTLNQGTNGLAAVFNNVTEIYGAEENFVIKNAEGKVGAWGSNLFGQLGTTNEYYYGVSANNGFLTDYSAKWSTYSMQSGNINAAELYIGKDYVVAAMGNELFLSGKNFYLNAGAADSTRNSLDSFHSFGVAYAVDTAVAPYKNAVRNVGLEFADDKFGTVKNGASGAFAKINAVSSVAANSRVTLKDAAGLSLKETDNLIQNRTVAAGAGFLYYISYNDNGTPATTQDDFSQLNMIGNGYANQAGNGKTNPTNKTHYGIAQRVGDMRDVVQVVAGRNQSDAGHLVNIDGKKLYSFNEDGGYAANDSQQIGEGDRDANTIASVTAGYADFANDTAYISAALTADGTVYAWNADENVKDLSEVLNPLLPGTEKIATIIGGYGYRLYALTTTGKLIQIKYNNGFTAKYHNAFNNSFDNATVMTIQNWMTESDYIANIHNEAHPADFELQKDLRRTVHFGKTASDIFAKVGLNQTTVSDTQLAQVGRRGRKGSTVNSTYDHDATGSFVGQNNTADALGFLLDASLDNEYFLVKPAADTFVVSNSVFSGNLLTGENLVWEGSDASIKFYYHYDGAKTLIDRNVVAQYVDFKIEVDQSPVTKNVANDIQFSFVPKKSTKGNTITMEFMIGRYSNAQEYDSATPVIYERKLAAIDIVIDATPGTTEHFSQQFGGVIPLLDVNGTVNKQFSVAAMDVSTGFDKLGNELAGLTGGIFGQSDFVSKVHSALTGGADAGFPSSTYAQELSYYDENNTRYYNSRYRYFAESIDGNLMYIQNLRINGLSIYKDLDTYVSATRKSVSVKVDLKTLLGITDWNAAIADPGSDASKIKQYLDGEKFDNKYGFYSVSNSVPVEGEPFQSGIVLDESGVLTLSYQVITFTALSMATDTATYNENYEIDKPILTRDNRASYLSYEILMREFREVQGKVVAYSDENWLLNQYVTVHTHASLKLKDSVIVGSVSGSPGNNVVRYNGSTNALDNGLWRVTIGEHSSYKVRLIDLMQMNALNTEGFDFKFSFGNSSVNMNGYYEGFVKSFNQNIIDPAKTYLTEDEMSFFFLENTEVIFSINIIKTAKNGSPFQINDGTGTLVKAEQIELQFIVRAQLTTAFGKKQTAPTKVSVSETVELSITDFITEDNIAPEFVQFSEAVVINTSKATVQIVTNTDPTIHKRVLRLKAVGSGVTYLRYTVTLLGRHSRSGEIQLEVKYISEYRSESNPLSITDREQVQLSDLSTFLQGENIHLGLTSLSVDRTAGNNGYGESNNGITVQHKATANAQWETVPVSETPYIQSATLEANDMVNIDNGAHLFVILKSVQQGSSVGVSRVLVHFATETAEGRVELIAAIVITPGHTDLTVTTTDGNGVPVGSVPLLINVQYNDGYQSNMTGLLQTYEMPLYGLDTTGKKMLNIPIAYFFSEQISGKKPGEGGRDYDSYAITQAAISDARVEPKNILKYLTCDPANNGKDLQIRPIYPTAELTTDHPDTIDGVRVTLTFTSTNKQIGQDRFQVSFYIRVSQIKMTLTQKEWITGFLIAGAIAFGFLFIIFLIRLIVFLKRRAEQKRIIKKNQMLIRMRDKMHHSTGTPSRSQAVKAKMKINDPKYAKMFDEMRKEKEAETGITLENSALAQKAENTSKTMDRVKASKKNKKSKKSIDDLKAELEAKRSALAQMQVPSGGAHVSDGDMTMDSAIIEDISMFDGDYNAELSREDVEDQIKAKLEEGGFVEFEPLAGDEDML